MKPSWPFGLRVVFWLALLGFLICTGQLVYYSLVLRTSPHVIGGHWALYMYAVGCITIFLGALGLRRPFTVALTLQCLLSMALITFQTWPMVFDIWKDIFSGIVIAGAGFPGSLSRLLRLETWYLVWNSICLSLNGGILLYLFSYEFRLFGPGKIDRKET